MRTFDYRSLPANLLEGAISAAVMRVYEDRGRLDALERLHPQSVGALSAQARFDTVDASTRIEGLYVDSKRIHALMKGAKPANDIEQQVAGLAEAFDLVREHAHALDVSTSTILSLYEALFTYRDLGKRSRYRKKNYAYVQVDGHMQAMPVSPIAAFETPLVLGGACDSLADALEGEAANPLIQIAMFTVDFLCIRPFDEGNGRIMRLFADLLLDRAGFSIVRYASIDRIMERSGMAYYDALNACVDGWDRSDNDYRPYIVYWLETIHQAYARLFDAIDLEPGSSRGKSERVEKFVMRSDGLITKRQVRDAFPDVSEATVENVLGKLVRDGAIRKLGAGRGTAYRVSE